MNILITGGAGFIGSHTADALIARGHRVRLLDNLQPTVHPKGRPDYLHPEAEFIRGDVRDADTFRRALDQVEAVYHLAAYQDYLPDFSTFFSVNAVSTALLYEILAAEPRRFKVGKVIVAASQAVMGEGRYRCDACARSRMAFTYPDIRLESQLARGQWDHTCPTCGQALQWQPSDESVVHPCNQYALSKHSQEQIAIQLGRRYDIPSTVMRYSIVQGPRQSFYNAYSGAMRIFALSLLFDRAPTIYEDGRQVRDFVNIQDVVAANLLVLESAAADYRVFNVGGGTAWTIMDFYAHMQQTVGKQLPPKLEGLYRYGDTRHIFSDTGRLQALGWRPKHSVTNSIRDYWRYLTTHPEQQDILAYAEQQMRRLNVVRKSGTVS
ncbi:MAG: NAD-dependent epimerase/dehydratase family protein [Desulfatitalea sp.]|nr:NAD-dependent epimerase/dehydratase family protein [Desulfatitalea sp.]NNK01322.1 NAD-dependent epimerase/dehydratase family protein [Desulfatitalea sp.]